MKIYGCNFFNGYRNCHYEYSLYFGSDRIGSNAEKYRGNWIIKRSRYSLYHWNTGQFWTKNFVNYAWNDSKLILKRKAVDDPPFYFYGNTGKVSSIVRMKIPLGCSDMILIRKW